MNIFDLYADKSEHEDLAASCSIERGNVDFRPFSDHGGLQKAWGACLA